MADSVKINRTRRRSRKGTAHVRTCGEGLRGCDFTYRLAPEYPFPSPLADTGLVFEWVLAHAEECGWDTEHIFAVGDSASAHILGLYLNLLTSPTQRERTVAWISRTAPDMRIPLPEDLKIRAVGLFSGQYRIESSHEINELTADLMKDFLPGGGTAEELTLIDVAGHVTAAFPPVSLVTATGDFLLGQAPVMADALLKAEVPLQHDSFASGKRHVKKHAGILAILYGLPAVDGNG